MHVTQWIFTLIFAVHELSFFSYGNIITGCRGFQQDEPHNQEWWRWSYFWLTDF